MSVRGAKDASRRRLSSSRCSGERGRAGKGAGRALAALYSRVIFMGVLAELIDFTLGNLILDCICISTLYSSL